MPAGVAPPGGVKGIAASGGSRIGRSACARTQPTLLGKAPRRGSHRHPRRLWRVRWPSPKDFGKSVRLGLDRGGILGARHSDVAQTSVGGNSEDDDMSNLTIANILLFFAILCLTL